MLGQLVCPLAVLAFFAMLLFPREVSELLMAWARRIKDDG